jgi:ABC-type nitrate/sulfonate/bicarbonate transport system substrate-binding protein
MTMKPTLVILVLLVVSVVTLSACVSQAPTANSQSTAPSPSPTPSLTTVKVGYLPVTTFGPLYLAQEEGYFARQGINLELVKFQSAPASLPALINGDIAVSGGQLSPAIVNAVTKGAHVRIVADKGRAAPSACVAQGFMVRQDLFDSGAVRNVSDLKGRRIMVNLDSSYGIYRVLAMGNLSTDDVEIVNMDFASAVIAFKNGGIDAGSLSEPYITQTLNSHSAVVFIPTYIYAPDLPTPLYYGPAFLDKDPELGRRFMIAYLQGAKQYNEGKTERNLAILGNYTKLDRELLNQSCWLPIDPTGDLPRQPVRDYVNWMYANGNVTQNPGDDLLFDTSYVNYANEVLRNSTIGKTP